MSAVSFPELRNRLEGVQGFNLCDTDFEELLRVAALERNKNLGDVRATMESLIDRVRWVLVTVLDQIQQSPDARNHTIQVRRVNHGDIVADVAIALINGHEQYAVTEDRRNHARGFLTHITFTV